MKGRNPEVSGGKSKSQKVEKSGKSGKEKKRVMRITKSKSLGSRERKKRIED